MLAAKPCRGIALRKATERAARSGSTALAAIAGCSLETHSTGQPRTSRMKPALGFSEPALVLSSEPQPQAKAALANALLFR